MSSPGARHDGELRLRLRDSDRSAATAAAATAASPVLSAIVEDTLLDGGSATLRGEGFATTAAGNVVLVGGERATVTSASDTLLIIAVPGACLPRRTAAVSVSVDGRVSNEVTTPVRPAETLAMNLGEMRIFPGGMPCLQLDATTSAERYLVGVQRVTAAAAGATPIRVSGVTSTGASNAIRFPGKDVLARTAVVPGDGSGRDRRDGPYRRSRP